MFFFHRPKKPRETVRQQPAWMPCARLPAGLQAFSAHSGGLSAEAMLMEPPSSLSPKENKDLQERGTNRKQAGKQCGLRLHSTSDQSL